MSEFGKVKQEVLQLKKEKAALQTLCDLFQDFITRARSPEEAEFVKATLRKIIEISNELTGADMSSLFLLDADGLVVESILARGEVVPDPAGDLIEPVLSKGLAGWVLRNRKIGLVNDTQADPRWLTFPDQPYFIGSALALPIISGDMTLGILTLMHSKPGHFRPETADLMRLTANQLALVLENAYLFMKLKDSYDSLGRAKKKIEAYSLALERELERGRRIQKDFLPRQLPAYRNWSIQAYFHPARQVSGDFYDIFDLPGGLTGLVIGDVCDKGVGSALFMALFRSLIRIFSGKAGMSESKNDIEWNLGRDADHLAAFRFTPAAVRNTIESTNHYISVEHDEMCMFATIFFCLLERATGKLMYINAGHEPVYRIDRQGRVESLGRTGPAVGLFPGADFKCRSLDMKTGDILFLYTDGVTTARDVNDRLFSRNRLVSLLTQSGASPADMIEKTKTAVFTYIGAAPLEDDLSMLAIQRTSP